eukprot:6197052-Pleurochrysis_carterae.AAC.1
MAAVLLISAGEAVWHLEQEVRYRFRHIHDGTFIQDNTFHDGSDSPPFLLRHETHHIVAQLRQHYYLWNSVAHHS